MQPTLLKGTGQPKNPKKEKNRRNQKKKLKGKNKDRGGETQELTDEIHFWWR
jgi:hypothetical protein